MLFMVLDDGETFSELAGCKIIDVNRSVEDDATDQAVKEICDGETDDGRVVAEIYERNDRPVLAIEMP